MRDVIQNMLFKNNRSAIKNLKTQQYFEHDFQILNAILRYQELLNLDKISEVQFLLHKFSFQVLSSQTV